MRLGNTLRLLIPTLGILLGCKFNHAYAAECKDKDLYTPYPISGDSKKYKVCFSETGDFKEYECPKYLTFIEQTRSCAASLDVMPKCTIPGEKFKSPFDNVCAEYIECDPSLEHMLKLCDAGTYFNPLYQDCVPKTEYDCENDTPDCLDPEFQDRKWVDKESCEYYYECVGDSLVSRKCPTGMYLDVHTQACMHNSAANGGCQVPNPQPNSPESIKTMCKGNVGKFLPDPNYCKAYYYCVDESTPYWSPCTDDRYFANGSCTKTRPTSCSCEDEDWDTNGKTSVNVPHPDNKKFYVCEKGQPPKEKTCPSNTTFNPAKKMCTS